MKITLNKVKAGQVFMLLKGSTAVYVRQHYDAGSKRFSVSRADDMNAERFLKGDTLVIVDFDY